VRSSTVTAAMRVVEALNDLRLALAATIGLDAVDRADLEEDPARADTLRLLDALAWLQGGLIEFVEDRLTGRVSGARARPDGATPGRSRGRATTAATANSRNGARAGRAPATAARQVRARTERRDQPGPSGAPTTIARLATSARPAPDRRRGSPVRRATARRSSAHSTTRRTTLRARGRPRRDGGARSVAARAPSSSVPTVATSDEPAGPNGRRRARASGDTDGGRDATRTRRCARGPGVVEAVERRLEEPRLRRREQSRWL
jgi:hypothetical protein